MTCHALSTEAPNCTRDNQLPPATGCFLPSTGLMAGRSRRLPYKPAPAGYNPFLVYLPQPLSHQQSLGHKKLQTTCQAKCHCVSVPILHWAVAGMLMLMTGRKRDNVKLGHRLQDTPFCPSNTNKEFGSNDEPLKRARG